MSSLLQSIGSSPYVLVHIVGPLAATIRCLCNKKRSSLPWLINDYTAKSPPPHNKQTERLHASKNPGKTPVIKIASGELGNEVRFGYIIHET